LNLKEKAGKFPDAVLKYYGLFSKSGFTKELEKLLKERKDIFLFSRRLSNKVRILFL